MKKIIVLIICMAIAVMFASSTFADLNDGLVAYYPFNGNANDESGNGHDGTVYGATLTDDRFGNPDSTYSFDGNDRIDVPDDPSLTLGSEPFTIVAWMQFSQLGSYYLMGHDEGGGDRNKWIFWVHSSGFFFHVNSPSTGGYNPVSYNGWVPEIDSWYFLVVKRDGNDFMLYINGSLVATGYDTRPIPDPNTTFQMGTAEPEHPERTFRGLLDDVRIYSRALSECEIQELYNGATAANLSISPASGNYMSTQGFDLGLIVEASCLSVVGGSATFDGTDVIDALAGCVVPGTLTSGGQTFRCPGLIAGDFGTGTHNLDVTLDLSDGSSVSDTVTWEVKENTEP